MSLSINERGKATRHLVVEHELHNGAALLDERLELIFRGYRKALKAEDIVLEARHVKEKSGQEEDKRARKVWAMRAVGGGQTNGKRSRRAGREEEAVMSGGSEGS